MRMFNYLKILRDFFYASSPKSAFEKECKNYHAFDKNKIDNKTHPIKPENTEYICPYCQ